MINLKLRRNSKYMNKYITFAKKDIGVFLCIIFYSIFLFIARTVKVHYNLDGADWYVFSSIQRLLFGLIELFVFVKIFKKEKWTNVINFQNFKNGLIAGSSVFLMILLYIAYFVVGAKSFINTTIPIVISCVFLQQITTGFWEELNCRAFVIEGYFSSEKRTWKTRLIYALLSFVIFGLMHAIEECDSFSFALYRFITTGIWGFIYASIYLYSHNILVPMLLHFIYDIFANGVSFVDEWNKSQLFIVLDNYGYFFVLGLMFIISIIYVVKKPSYCSQ